LLRWAGTGEPTVLATLDVHPAGLLVRENNIIFSALGTAFTQGPAFTATNQMLVLNRLGKPIRTTPLPDVKFLNAVVELVPDAVLIADSIAGCIWQFTQSTGDVAVWLADPSMTTDPAQTLPLPGVNGLKLQGEWLYMSNSSRGELRRVRVANGKPTGAVELAAQLGPIDDFAFLADETIAAAKNGQRVIHIDRDGKISNMLA